MHKLAQFATVLRCGLWIAGLLAADEWISVTGADRQPIELNVANIVSVRSPRGEGHFSAEVRCLIHTTDGKVVTVIEPCDVVEKLLDAKPD
jgi:hypothetical protein